MRLKRDNFAYLHHINDSVQKIQKYTEIHTQIDFFENDWDQDAVVRNLEIIGEAANNLDTEFQEEYPEIPWRKIIDFRNLVVHDYADIDVAIVWNIVSEYLPELSSKIKTILDQNHT